jgi:putative MATE family efflux protein
MVGVLGSISLAAVGIGGFANFMAIAVIIGLASGVQTMVARRKGEERVSELAVPLNGGLLMALIVGLPLAFAMYHAAPTLFPLLNADPAVIDEGVPYFQVRVMAAVAIGMNFSFRGYWAGVGLTGLYLRTLLIMHVCNVVLNYLLIFGKFGFPELGSYGAGLATTLSIHLGTGIYFFLALRRARTQGFLRGVPGLETMKTMIRLAVPSAVQQFLFATGYTCLFWIIGLVGTDEVAAANVLTTLMLVALLPAMGLGLAALSLAGEELGRGQPAAAKQWGWDVAKVALVFISLLALPGLIAPDLVLAGFLHDPEVMAMARWPLRLSAATIIFDAAGMVLMNALLGAGAARQVMIVATASQWIVGLPLAYLAGPVLGYGLFGIWLCQGGYRVLQGAIFAVLWARGKWVHIKV